MAVTNFAALTDEQLTVWSRDLWKAARNNSFVSRFTGTGPNSMIQRITELTKSEKGARAVITLVADLEGDGVVGDNQLEGNEEAGKAFDLVIQIDQLRHGTRHKGRMADQRSIVNFRSTAKDTLGYWIGDRIDQMAFLTLSGVGYEFTNNGIRRPNNSQLKELEFAADVTPPTANRHLRWSALTGLEAGNTGLITAADTPSYAMLVQAKAYAKTQYIRGIRGKGNEEYYHVFMHPLALAKLKLDPDYLANLRHAGPRGTDGPIFSGSVVTQDGLVIHEFRHVFNTSAAPSGDRWGALGAVHGQRTLFCGAQAMGMADLGNPYWNEEYFDYGNAQGISVGKMMGLLKPVFHSQASNSKEDFGLMVIDTAI